MMFRCFCLLVVLSPGLIAAAAEEFRAPEAHPVERYMTLWNKNPFTLKTAPAAIQRESFAKDLALAGITRIGADTTVLLVNTKTREYLRLKNEEMHSSGMKVKSVNLRDSRADSSVEVIAGSETSVLKYDTGFLAQMAGQATPANVPNNNGTLSAPIPAPIQPPVLPDALQPPGAVPQLPVGKGTNQNARSTLSPGASAVNGSPMTTPAHLIPTVPTRRARSAPVGRPDAAVPPPLPAPGL